VGSVSGPRDKRARICGDYHVFISAYESLGRRAECGTPDSPSGLHLCEISPTLAPPILQTQCSEGKSLIHTKTSGSRLRTLERTCRRSFLLLAGIFSFLAAVSRAQIGRSSTAWNQANFHIERKGVVERSDIILQKLNEQPRQAMGNGRLGVAVWAQGAAQSRRHLPAPVFAGSGSRPWPEDGGNLNCKEAGATENPADSGRRPSPTVVVDAVYDENSQASAAGSSAILGSS
jgi:hypothetical protein